MTPNLDQERVERAAEAAYEHEPMLGRGTHEIARRNEDAPEIHELSAMLSAELTEKDRR